jgi:replicative DNA helicase
MSDRRDLEFLVLCAACDRGGLEAAMMYIDDGCFAHDDLRGIWKVIMKLRATGIDGVDYAMLADAVSDAGIDVAKDYLQRIASAAWEAGHAQYHARRLRDVVRADRLRLLGMKMERMTVAPDDVVRELKQDLDDITGEAESGEQSIGQLLLAPTIASVIVPTGFPILDQKLGGGLRSKQLLVIGGRPGTGKTSLMGQMAAQMAMAGYRTMLVTIEMSGREMVSRLKRAVSVERLSELQLFIRDDLDHFHQIDSACRTAIRQRGLHAVFVDYIQRVSVPGQENREKEIRMISSGLKDLARHCNIPVVAGSQLKRGEGRPKLSDLRESGAIEQDADVVILLGHHDDGEGLRTFDVAKQRNGATSQNDIAFDGPRTWFSEVVSETVSPAAYDNW